MSHVTLKISHVTHVIPGEGCGASSHQLHEWCESRLITQGMGHVTLKISHVTHVTPGEGCGASSHQLHEWCESRHITVEMSHVTFKISHVTLRISHVTLKISHVTHVSHVTLVTPGEGCGASSHQSTSGVAVASVFRVLVHVSVVPVFMK